MLRTDKVRPEDKISEIRKSTKQQMFVRTTSSLLIVSSLLSLGLASSHESDFAASQQLLKQPQQQQHLQQQQQQPLTQHHHPTISNSAINKPQLGPYEHAALIATSQATPISRESNGDQLNSAKNLDKRAVSLDSLMDENYLDLPANNLINTTPVGLTHKPLLGEISDKNAPKTNIGKTRRQIEQRAKTVDWWTKLAGEKGKQRVDSSKSSQPKQTKTSIYQEQPLEQNAISTIRHQLTAIRNKHRLLLLKSVPQLMQLDQKLVSSYKLCLKRKMPLYAGMLYRTRDYVVRMANEVKNERQILEAMTKQIQKTLRHKVTNSSLVRDYNRQLLTQTTAASLAATPTSPSKASSNSRATSQLAQHMTSTSRDYDSDYKLENGDDNDLPAQGTEPSPRLLMVSLDSADTTLSPSSQRVSFIRASSQTRGEQPPSRDTTLNSVHNYHEQNIINDTADKQYSFTSGPGGDKSRLKFKKLLNGNAQSSQSLSPSYPHPASAFSKRVIASDARDSANQAGHGEPVELPGEFSDSNSQQVLLATDKRSRQQKYTVHINEVNLKRVLVKTQALIDRINASSHELMNVVEDIVYLFKLTSGDQNSRKFLGKTNRSDKLNANSALMELVNNGFDQKRTRKMMAKSPFKVFFERYGKLTMSSPPQGSLSTASTVSTVSDSSTTIKSTWTDINALTSSTFMDIHANNLPELKPIFDQTSTPDNKDLIDLELGFDSPAMLDT